VSFAGAGSLFARFDNLKLQEASLVDVPPERRPGGEAELALSSPSPNPARGAVAVWLSLPAARIYLIRLQRGAEARTGRVIVLR